MKLIFLFYSICFKLKFFQTNAATSCKETKYNLVPNRYHYFASPNYPKKFEPQTQCNWLLVAPKGYRIRLEFLRFYLMSSKLRGCVYQKLTIDDMFSNQSDGPYCGNSLPPVLRSTGNILRVKLQSDSKDIKQMFRGFQIKVTPTFEVSSPRIRDERGKWKSYKAQKTSAPTGDIPIYPPDEESLENLNGNNAVELQNKLRNFKNNMQSGEEGQMEFNPLDLPSTKKPRIKKKTRRVTTTRQFQFVNLKSDPITQSNQFTEKKKGKTSSYNFSVWIIIIVAVVLFIFVVLTMFYKRKRKLKKEKKRNDDIKPSSKGATATNFSQERSCLEIPNKKSHQVCERSIAKNQELSKRLEEQKALQQALKEKRKTSSKRKPNDAKSMQVVDEVYDNRAYAINSHSQKQIEINCDRDIKKPENFGINNERTFENSQRKFRNRRYDLT